MQRLGHNRDGYRGETLDIAGVLREVASLAGCHRWHRETLAVPCSLPVFTLQRSPANPRRRVYLSTGIHGDEPAGPLAARQLLAEDQWPADCAFWLCPCLNPEGFRVHRRENETGLDLNRDYRAPRSPTVQAHIAWLERQPLFDLALCLHEDWESHGFYLYELNPDSQRSLAEAMVTEVSRVCPIDASPLIEGREAAGGIIRPKLDPDSRPDWPEAFHLIRHKTRLSYTLEAPSDWPLAVRVSALVTGVRAALAALA